MLGTCSILALATVGCGTSATSAAQVGDVAIAESTVFDRTAAVVAAGQQQGQAAPAQSVVAQLNRAQATSAIRSRLLDVAAQQRGVVVTEDQVNAAVAGGNGANAASALGAPASQERQAVRDLLMLEALVSAQPASGAPISNVTVKIDGVSVPSRDEAVTTRTRFLADPKAVDQEIAAAASPVQPQSVSLLQTPSVAPTGVFQAQPGAIILYPNKNGYFVVRVLERTTEPAVLTTADLSAQQLDGQFDLGSLILQPYAQQAGVTVNPRLGVWDPLSLRVVPGGSGL